MIVRQFLRWVQTAPAGERADATGALARAFLYSPLDAADRAAAEAAMTVLLDDPSPMVREALAIALAASPEAPHAIIHALAHDLGDIAALVLAQTPVLGEDELIEALAAGDWRAQCAVACRVRVPPTLALAVAEIGGADAAFALLQNPGAVLDASTLARLAERHGHDADVRNALLARSDLPAHVRQAAVAQLSRSLSAFATGCGWLSEARARKITAEADDKAIVAIAGTSRADEMRGLVRHLRKSGKLTTALILRALLSGNLPLFEEALSDLSGVPLSRVSGFVHARRSSGFEAVCNKAGIPKKVLPAFRAALDAMHEVGFVPDAAAEARLSRSMVERALTAVDAMAGEDVTQLLLMLRRFAAEASRDEARLITRDMMRETLIAA
jgi:uncharacterized protein (DUF2336 family)